MQDNIFFGLFTAIVTPFRDDQPDLVSLKKILEYQIANQVDGVVVCGSTGEGNNVELSEYISLLKSTVEIVQSKIFVVAGCCSSSTQHAVNIALAAAQTGVDGIMCTTPPYVKPTAEGIYQHIKAVHDAVNIPIMLYNSLSRTGTGLDDATILRVAQLPRVIALKDTGVDIERPLRLKPIIKENFNFLTGDDPITLAYNAHGGAGCISVAANIVPKLCKNLQLLCASNHFAEALTIHQQLFPLYQALFTESNPIPVKYALSTLGLCSNEIRLPLVMVNANSKNIIDRVMTEIRHTLLLVP